MIFSLEEILGGYASTDEEELAKAEDPYERFLLASQPPGEKIAWKDRQNMIATRQSLKEQVRK